MKTEWQTVRKEKAILFRWGFMMTPIDIFKVVCVVIVLSAPFHLAAAYLWIFSVLMLNSCE